MNKKGFSLAETLISLMIISVILVATMPLVTVKTKTGGNSIWQRAANFADIYYCGGGNCAVGIGTSSPYSKLDIAGVGSSSDSKGRTLSISSFSSSYSNENGTPFLSFLKSHSDTLGTLATTQNQENLGEITFSGVGTGNAYNTAASIYVTQEAAAGNGDWYTPSSLHFRVSNGTGTAIEPLIINNSGHFGIGTTPSSDYVLNVQDNIYEDSIFYLKSTTHHSGIKLDAQDDAHAYLDFYVNGTKRANIYWDDDNSNGGHLIINDDDTTGDEQNTVINPTSGNVGIRTDDPQYVLDVAGQMRATGGLTTTSDKRLKNIKGEYKKGLNEILSLKPVSYSFKKTKGFNFDPNKTYAGLVAQDVQKVFPEAVSKDNKGYLNLDKQSIDTAMINAVKELKAENDSLKQKVDNLEARLERLEKTQNTSSPQKSSENPFIRFFSWIKKLLASIFSR